MISWILKIRGVQPLKLKAFSSDTFLGYTNLNNFHIKLVRGRKFKLNISVTHMTFAAEFPQVFKEHGSARIINGFETNGPLPFQLQLVFKVPSIGFTNCGDLTKSVQITESINLWSNVDTFKKLALVGK